MKSRYSVIKDYREYIKQARGYQAISGEGRLLQIFGV